MIPSFQVSSMNELWQESNLESPMNGLTHNGSTSARQSLYKRFADRIHVRPSLSRKLVSYQGNKSVPGLRWMKYKEGFSAGLVTGFLSKVQAERVLDPFSGAGTSILTACAMGLQGTGIEIMAVGNLAARAIAAASNGLETDVLDAESSSLLDAISRESYDPEFSFPRTLRLRSTLSRRTRKET